MAAPGVYIVSRGQQSGSKSQAAGDEPSAVNRIVGIVNLY
jgi:hypothetical protein